jgi:gp16 family phage-associated protein
MNPASAKIEPRRGRRPAPRPDPARIQAARDQLGREGKTIVAWAAEHGEEPDAVQKVLSGQRACTTGAQHRIAVKLGIKDGAVA